ncbi:MAG: DnaA/Hda family protein, partial [Alphaproteobacteria bacterium]|nr:DnaA/Hda family protein [Alphaproteobacteria bacterium]
MLSKSVAAQQEIAQSSANDSSDSAAWLALRERLRERLGETAFRRWLEPVTGAVSVNKNSNKILTLSMPTRFVRDWVEAHYGDMMRVLWRQLVQQGDINFSVASPLVGKKEASISTVSPAIQTNAPGAAGANYAFPDGEDAQTVADTLDPRFTFENFVVGKPNELAYAAARRVADAETPTFNPLFLYGGVGLGKTHLMHAIAWQIRKNFPHRRVIYMSAEKFMYQFVRALRYKDMVSFKDQFRSVDVLMIDDVQFIGGKDTTQE